MNLKDTADRVARSIESWPEWKRSTCISRPPRKDRGSVEETEQQQAKKRAAQLRDVARGLKRIASDCRCHDAFSERGMVDPECSACDLRDELMAAVAVIEKAAKDYA